MSDERLIIHPRGAVHWSHGERVTPHASQAWKLVIGLEGPIHFVRRGGESGSARCILVAPYVDQALSSEGLTASYFAEPGTPNAPYTSGEGFRVLEGRLRDRVTDIARLRAPTPSDDHAIQREIYSALGLSNTSAGNAKVSRALALVAEDPETTIERVAEKTRLSSTRLRHLVHDTTGLTLRSHRVWHRTMRAVELLLRGDSIASAAVLAGFADHGHFTRSFVRFFGRTPSSIHGTTTVLGGYSPRQATTSPSHQSIKLAPRDISPSTRNLDSLLG